MASEPSVEAAESAPEDARRGRPPDSSATDEPLPTPAGAESGADPKSMARRRVVNGDDDR